MGQQIENALAIGTIVDSGKVKYRIENVLGQGGFGITYKVTASKMDGNIPIEVTYALKEFYMKDYSDRDKNSGAVISTAKNVALSRKSFLSEARRLASIKHKNVIAVNEVFEANNTAYYVMQYLEGESLYKYLARKGALPVSEALRLMSPIFDAVGYLHKNRLTHYDIKPDNIMLSKNRDGELQPMLIDFGLSKHYDAQGNETSTLQQICVSPGYSPFEQYGEIHTFTPQADVYALAATLYCCLTGSVPPDCSDYRDEPKSMLPVIAKGLENVDAHIREAILSAMKSSKVERTQSVETFVAHLNQSADIPKADDDPNATIEIPIPEPVDPKKTLPIKDPNPPRPPKPDKNLIKLALIALGVIAVGGIVLLVMGRLVDSSAYTTDRLKDSSEKIEQLIVDEPQQPVAELEELVQAAGREMCVPDQDFYGEAVDLGLSVYWCDRNVGADSPEDYDDYYTFYEALYFARIYLDSGWRLPTKAELEELNNKCTWSWTGSGYRVIGPNGNSIYLPAAGSHMWNINNVGSHGYYWSPTPGSSDGACYLYFDSDCHYVDWSYRSYEHSVRPVRAKRTAGVVSPAEP